MASSVRENKDESRFEIFVDDVLAGWVEYHEHDGMSAFLHTEIKPEFGGQGLASQLIRASLDTVKARGCQVEPFCSFVRGFMKKHPEYVSLVPPAELARFGFA